MTRRYRQLQHQHRRRVPSHHQSLNPSPHFQSQQHLTHHLWICSLPRRHPRMAGQPPSSAEETHHLRLNYWVAPTRHRLSAVLHVAPGAPVSATRSRICETRCAGQARSLSMRWQSHKAAISNLRARAREAPFSTQKPTATTRQGQRRTQEVRWAISTPAETPFTMRGPAGMTSRFLYPPSMSRNHQQPQQPSPP